MKLKKNKKNFFKFSFVMGRFSEKIGDKFQYFPIDNWQKETEYGKKFNFDGVEWIISDYSNTIFNSEYLNEIKKKFKTKKLSLISIYFDFIMKEPLHKISIKNLDWIINKVCLIQKKIKVNRITIPIEEDCRFHFDYEKKIALKRLEYIIKKLGKKSKISIETDIPPHNLIKILDNKKLKKLGLLLDLGNIRANGFKLINYINKFPDKIIGIHIKYREKLYGQSKAIPKKFEELSILRKNIYRLKMLNDVTFQTYRSEKNFINDMKQSIKNFNEIFYK